jgi:two-component system cell cycle sensor histidine kinase/response regulator CckA
MGPSGTLTLTAEPVYSYQQFSFATVTSPDRFVHLTVQDDGCGIPPDVLPHIFEPLFTTKKARGTGLGLSIARQVITRHAGHMFVESTVRRGTTMHLFIPATTADFVEGVGAVSNPALSARTCNHILLVEDDPAVAAGITALLESNGINVTTVHTGGDAVRAIETEVPDAVVLDVGLPDIDGAEVYRKLSERIPNLPVIFSTGHAEEAKALAVAGAHNVRFLRKPYDVDTLMESLAELLAASAAKTNSRQQYRAAPGAA